MFYRYNNMDVLVHHGTCPVLSLRSDLKVSDEFRELFNAWLCARFGLKPIIPDGQVLVLEKEGKIVCSPSTFANLQKQGVIEAPQWGEPRWRSFA